MKIFDTYYICRTGKLNQYFTLYIHRTITTKTFYNDVCYYVQNLSHDRDEAIDKAKAMMAERLAGRDKDYGQCMDFSDSKKREYCDLTIFGLEWKKTAKGFIIDMNTLPQDKRDSIWETWRTDKDALKEAGFAIFKGRDSSYDQWFFFFRNCSNEEMEVKLATLKLRKKEKIVKGSFIGNIKERITVTATLIDHKSKINTWTGGYTQIVTFEDDKGNTLISFYGGQKEIPEVGTKMELTGTVKKHEEFNGVNQTNLIRIKL